MARVAQMTVFLVITGKAMFLVWCYELCDIWAKIKSKMWKNMWPANTIMVQYCKLTNEVCSCIKSGYGGQMTACKWGISKWGFHTLSVCQTSRILHIPPTTTSQDQTRSVFPFLHVCVIVFSITDKDLTEYTIFEQEIVHNTHILHNQTRGKFSTPSLYAIRSKPQQILHVHIHLSIQGSEFSILAYYTDSFNVHSPMYSTRLTSDTWTYMVILEPFSKKLRTSLVWFRMSAGAMPGLYGENVTYTAPSVICTSTFTPPYWKQKIFINREQHT